MTVPPLFGWESIVTVLVVLLVVAVVFFAASASGRASTARPDWQAWLDARSSRHGPAAADPEDPPPGTG